MKMLDLEAIREHQTRLENHPLLTTDVMENKRQLATFMEHHVYCVWDFMCLVKCLQNYVAPTAVPWIPSKYTKNGAARLINSIMVAEESDCFDGRYISHFDLYIEAMEEIGADPTRVLNFVERIHSVGLYEAMEVAPAASRAFMKSTFGFINSGKPHVAAAAFAFGRETVIPGMYMNMVKQLGITEQEAPKFYAWLKRHIEVDTDDHGPAAVELVNIFCDGNSTKIQEAQDAGHKSIDDKMAFWDTVRHVIHGR
jgi:hypothetical protein